MKNYIYKDKSWFNRLCSDILHSDDRTIRNLVRVFSGQAREYQQNYWYSNRTVLNQKQNKKYAELPIEIKLQRQQANRDNYRKTREYQLEQKRKKHKENYPKLRLAVLQYYGNGKLACVCCGESNIRFLTIDHINNDGKQHRMKVRPGNILRWIKSNNFPKGFQTMCFNCNSGRALNKGICPHKEQQSMLITVDCCS